MWRDRRRAILRSSGTTQISDTTELYNILGVPGWSHVIYEPKSREMITKYIATVKRGGRLALSEHPLGSSSDSSLSVGACPRLRFAPPRLERVARRSAGRSACLTWILTYSPKLFVPIATTCVTTSQQSSHTSINHNLITSISLYATIERHSRPWRTKYQQLQHPQHQSRTRAALLPTRCRG